MKRMVFLLSAFAIACVLFTCDGIATARAEQPNRAEQDFRNDRNDRRSEMPIYRADRNFRNDRSDRRSEMPIPRADRDYRHFEMPVDRESAPQKPRPKNCPKCGSNDIGVNYLGWKWCKKCGTVIERP